MNILGKKTQILKIDSIEWDEKLYPRNSEDWFVSYTYAQALKAGAVFPPIVVCEREGRFLGVDGKHRCGARKRNGEEHIQSEILTGLSDNEIYVKAGQLNSKHGRQLSPQEKRKIAVRMEEMGYDTQTISTTINVPLNKLETFKIQKIINTITGEEVVIKSPLKHLSGENVDFDIDEIQKGFTAPSQTNMLNQFIALLENNLLNLKNKEIAKKVEKIKELLKAVKIPKKQKKGKKKKKIEVEIVGNTPLL